MPQHAAGAIINRLYQLSLRRVAYCKDAIFKLEIKSRIQFFVSIVKLFTFLKSDEMRSLHLPDFYSTIFLYNPDFKKYQG